MADPHSPALPRWSVSILAVLAAAGLGWLLAPSAGAESAYLLFTVAVMVSARYGGLWSGIAATLLGGAIVLGVIVPAPGSPAQWLLFALFLAVGTCISWLTRTLAGTMAVGQEQAEDARRLAAELAEATAREEALRGSEAQLRAREEELREAGRVKDEFLAVVAHELRTPLSAMLGWAHVLREEKVDEATSNRALDAILRNARLQTRLISDLLDISRIVAGNVQVEMQTVEPVSVIRAALETVRPAAEAKTITLTSNVDAEAGPVAGDPSRLQQVLWNLLTNSIKFTPNGGSVAVLARAVDGQLEVTVEDSGPGIPPDFLPYVFDRFRQAGSAHSRGKGLGLGLAITRHLVERHDGTITARNREPGPGAVFTIRLPIKPLRPGEVRPSPSPTAEVPDAAALPSLDGLAVLIVDDGDEARDVVATILKKRGARVTAVGSGGEALRALAEHPPDLLLLDLELADAPGDSLIRKIRSLPAAEGSGIPAIALAAFGTLDRTRALLAGFQLQLAKPVRPAELVAAVASLTGRTRPAMEAQPTPA